MGCVAEASGWLPCMADEVLLLRPWPFLKGALMAPGSSATGEVGEDSTRVFSASTSACSTSICRAGVGGTTGTVVVVVTHDDARCVSSVMCCMLLPCRELPPSASQPSLA